LTRQSPSALRAKISNFYNVAFADQGSRGSPLIIASGLDGRLRLYDATLHEVRVLRDPLVGTTLATYFDPERDRLYLFATAPSLPDTSDALAVLELKDRELRTLTKTNNFPGSISALGLGYLAGRDGLYVAAVLETNSDFETESVVYLFNLRE